MNTSTDKKEIAQIIQDTVSHAKDSWFSENSNLVDDIIKKMDSSIEQAVEKHMNNHIKDMNFKIDILTEHLLQWKTEITPQIEAVKVAQNWGKVSLGLITVLATIGGFVIMLIKFIKGTI